MDFNCCLLPPHLLPRTCVMASDSSAPDLTEKPLSSEHLIDGHLLSAHRDDVRLPDGGAVASGRVGVFDRAGETLRIAADSNLEALVLAGEPLDEPIVGSGPFVMNTEGEIRQAMLDDQSGKMGRLD